MTQSQQGQANGLWRRPGLAGLAFALGLLLFSWPFWAAAPYREPGFLFLYLFLCWALLIGLLLVLGRALARTQEPPPTSPEQAARRDV